MRVLARWCVCLACCSVLVRVCACVKLLARDDVLFDATLQIYMEIAATPDDVLDVLNIDEAVVAKGVDPSTIPYSHIEVSPLAMLSLAASLTPFSDLNQSPRNMYQCQMGKQTMGTPLHAFPHRADNKVRLRVTASFGEAVPCWLPACGCTGQL